MRHRATTASAATRHRAWRAHDRIRCPGRGNGPCGRMRSSRATRDRWPGSRADSGSYGRRSAPRQPRTIAYLSSTLAPASSSFFLSFSARPSCTPSLTAFGARLDQVLGLLEAEAGDRAHLLDDVDLLVAGRRQDDGELVLLLGRSAAAAAPGPRQPRRPARRRETPHFSSSILLSSAASRTVRVESSSTSFSRLAICHVS